VAYAVPSSLPYSWQSSGDFLNYGQWKHGATWATAACYSDFCDADTHAKPLQCAAPAGMPPRTHE
jgi:hypothetical protein